jgi:alkylhydroperoxidase/carboxymuconolactone decarboxylase family protein YurZ
MQQKASAMLRGIEAAFWDFLIRMAANNGAIKEEITETLQHLVPYANFSGHLGGSEHY